MPQGETSPISLNGPEIRHHPTPFRLGLSGKEEIHFHADGFNVYPDPSGRARKTSAGIGETDFSILKDAGFRVIAPSKAPNVTDRINEVNALFTNAREEHRLFISKSCPKLIHCLEGLTYREDTMEPDKRLGLEHNLDALGYLIHSEFPLVKHEVAFIPFRL